MPRSKTIRQTAFLPVCFVMQWKKEQAKQLKDANEKDKEDKRIMDMIESRNMRKKAGQFVRDLVHYLCFLLAFTSVVFAARVGNSDAYNYGVALKEAMETPRYKLIVDQNSMWKYLNLDLIPTLYKLKDYNGEPLGPDKQGNVLQFNSIVGGVRLR